MLEHILYASAALIALTEPLAELPIFLTIVEGRSSAEIRNAAFKVALGAFVILSAAAIGGTEALQLFGVSLSAFRAAAGFLLIVIGMQMLHGGTSLALSDPARAADRDDQLWVPFLMPLIAGPAAIAIAISLSFREEPRWFGLPVGTIVAIGITSFVLLVTLLLAVPLQRVMRPRVARITERFFGVILVAIGFQMGMSGVRGFFFGT